MKKITDKLVDKLLTESSNPLKLKILQKIFNTGIAFNIPHGFKFINLTDSSAQISLPYKRLNMNHLSGIHACAIATLGEYPAGLSLIKNFSPSKHRLIMKKLNAEYFLQAREDLLGTAKITKEEVERLKKEIELNEKSEVLMETEITNSQNEVVAIIQTTWQIKSWNQVSFK